MLGRRQKPFKKSLLIQFYILSLIGKFGHSNKAVTSSFTIGLRELFHDVVTVVSYR